MTGSSEEGPVGQEAEKIDDAEIVDEKRHQPTVAALARQDTSTSQLVQPAASTAAIEKAFADYSDLCLRLLDQGDYQRIGSRQFRKKSGWRKLSTAMGVTLKLVDRLKEREGRSIVFAEFVTRATAPNGRSVEGWGSADLFERCCQKDCTKNHAHCEAAAGRECPGTIHWSHPNHDVPATAETRSKNRASSDLFGMGEVSAEEIVGEGEAYSPPHGQQGDPVSDDPKAICPHCKSACQDFRADIEAGRKKDTFPKWKCSNTACKAGKDGKPWASWDDYPFEGTHPEWIERILALKGVGEASMCKAVNKLLESSGSDRRVDGVEELYGMTPDWIKAVEALYPQLNEQPVDSNVGCQKHGTFQAGCQECIWVRQGAAGDPSA